MHYRGVVSLCFLICFPTSAMHKQIRSRSPNISFDHLNVRDHESTRSSLEDSRRKYLKENYERHGLHIFFPTKFELVLEMALASEGYVSSLGAELSRALTELKNINEEKAFLLFKKKLEEKSLQWEAHTPNN